MADSGRTLSSIQAWTGLVVSFGNAAAVLLPEAGPARIPLCVVFASIGPGCALMSHARPGDAATAWGLAIALSLTIVALVAVTMAWGGWWHPVAGSVALSALSAASCGAALARGVVIGR